MSPRRRGAREAAVDAAPIFFALGDATRLQLVSRLCREGPLPIAELSAESEVTRQAVTKHLHALVDAGVVRCTAREGRRQRLWEVQPRRLEEARRYLETISQQWDHALARLKAFVET